MYLLHFEKIGLQLKELVGLLNKLEKSRSILLQDEQIPKHDDILFLISLGTNISSISLRLDWHLCSACLCFRYCIALPHQQSKAVLNQWQVELSRTNLGSIEVHFAANSFFNFVFVFCFFLNYLFEPFFWGEDCKAISY